MAEERTIRWGLLGSGIILDRWMQGARQVKGMEIAAIASRTRASAEKMAARYDIPEVLTYDEMVAREDIDIVYVPVPHTAHKELAIKAMNAGKHVLVEKPAAVCAADFKEMAECARKNGVFLMEAVWTRFFPTIIKAKELIAQGAIGEVRMIESSFAFRVGDDYSGRLTDPEQAGGGLLDVGVYNLHFARMIMERDPVKLTGLAAIGTDELKLQVDEQAGFIGMYENGALAVSTCGIRTATVDTAMVYGTKGYLEIPVFWKPFGLKLVADGETTAFDLPIPQTVEGMTDEGYQLEIRYVNDCLRNGVTESPMMPWEETLAVLEQCDQLRAQWGLKYPFE